MNKLLKVTSLLILALRSFSAYSAAQDSPATVATNHVLKGTYNNNGNFNGSVPAATFTAIDTELTVACPGTSGTCTIQADMWIENGGETSSLNANAICLYVDGTQASSLCGANAGETPSDGDYVQSSTSQSITGLAPGTHTVQMYFFSKNGAKAGYYNSNYRVYKP